MPTRFIGKNLRNKVVRPLKNSVKYNSAITSAVKGTENAKKEETSSGETPKKENKENKKNKKEKNMINEDKLVQMETIAGTNTENNIKVEKKEKGLYEKVNTILLTEDNKMLLND